MAMQVQNSCSLMMPSCIRGSSLWVRAVAQPLHPLPLYPLGALWERAAAVPSRRRRTIHTRASCRRYRIGRYFAVTSFSVLDSMRNGAPAGPARPMLHASSSFAMEFHSDHNLSKEVHCRSSSCMYLSGLCKVWMYSFHLTCHCSHCPSKVWCGPCGMWKTVRGVRSKVRTRTLPALVCNSIVMGRCVASKVSSDHEFLSNFMTLMEMTAWSTSDWLL